VAYVHDLYSYMEYAAGNVNENSTVFRGTLYEYSVQRVLTNHFGALDVVRRGRAGDKGVDLTGYWNSAVDSEKQISFFVQCKSSAAKLNGRLFREMAGVYNLHASKSTSSLVIVASPSLMTQNSLKEFQRLTVPLVYCRIEYVLPVFDGKLQQYWSAAVEDGTAVYSILANGIATKLLEENGLSIKQDHMLRLDPLHDMVQNSVKATVGVA
jgi:hypothetical protein